MTDVDIEEPRLEDPCGHPDEFVSKPRFRRIANGNLQYMRQCNNCGKKIGDYISHKIAYEETNGDPEPFDEAMADRYRRKNDYDISVNGDAWVISEFKKEFGWYEEYLQSSEWREIHKKIFNRCQGICEGCLERPMVLVHHLTYKHVCAEFMHELRGFCKVCHDRIHDKDFKAGVIHKLVEMELVHKKIDKHISKESRIEDQVGKLWG
jgi:hypothetical protein